MLVAAGRRAEGEGAREGTGGWAAAAGGRQRTLAGAWEGMGVGVAVVGLGAAVVRGEGVASTGAAARGEVAVGGWVAGVAGWGELVGAKIRWAGTLRCRPADTLLDNVMKQQQQQVERHKSNKTENSNMCLPLPGC